MQDFPEGWPYVGQGVNGWPEYGWWQKWYPNQDFGLTYIKEGMQDGATNVSVANATAAPLKKPGSPAGRTNRSELQEPRS